MAFEAGRYRAIVDSQSFSETQKGTPVFNVWFTVNEALEDQDLPMDSPAQKLDFYLSEKAAEMTLKKLRFLGFEGNEPMELDPRFEGFFDMTGKEIEVRCTINANGWCDWDVVMPGMSNRKELEPSAVKGLSFGKMQSQFRAAAAKPAANGAVRKSPF